jgi:iron complex outermembrane recepter protein
MIGVVCAAHAVAADQDAAEGPPANTGATVEEIVVTAQRREEKLSRTPISITAFSQKTMDDLHVENFSDLATVTPGLVIPPSGGHDQDDSDVAIRGIFSGGNAPTTQFYIDETPVAIRTLPGAGPSSSPHPLIFDLERVEVLRGPQGTLFGSSAMGGAIRYITPQPSLTTTSGLAKAEFGYTDGGTPSYEVGAAYGAPLVTGVAGFRVSAWYQSTGGWIDREDPYTGDIVKHNANASDSYVVRPAFTWAPLDGLTITPAVFIQHMHSADPATYWVSGLPNPERSGEYASGAIPEPLTDDMRVYSLALKYDFAKVRFQSDTSYLDRSQQAIDDFTHAAEYIYSGYTTPFVPNVPPSFHDWFADSTFTHAWQQQLRLSSQDDPDSRVSWVGGLYYRHAFQGVEQCLPGSLDPLTQAIAGQNSLEFTGFPNYTLPNGQTCNAYTNFKTVDTSAAAFGEATVRIVGGLKANIGVRVDHTEVKDQRQISAGPLNGLTYAYQLLPDEVATPVTPRAGLSYQIDENDMVYASAAKGYRPGGGNGATSIGNPLCTSSLDALGLTVVPSTFGSDSLWSYEVGAKGSLLDRRLAFEASGFLIHWDNIQTSVFLPSCSEGFTANRGKAVSRGFDLQLSGVIGEHLKAGASVGYTDAFYPNAAYGAPSGGATPLLNAAGDKLPNVLPWTVAANVEYSHDISPLWSGGQSYLRLDYRWLSAANAINPNQANFDPETDPYQNPSYGILNIRLGVIHEGLDLSAYVNNAANSDPRLHYTHDSFGDPLFYAAAIRPRTVGLTAFYRF